LLWRVLAIACGPAYAGQTGLPDAWQIEALRAITGKNPRVLILGCRQVFGKSEVAAIYVAACVLKGLPVIVALPTEEQSFSIIGQRVSTWLSATELALGLKRTASNSTRLSWDNGGTIRFLSTNKDAFRSTHGRTAAVTIIDEAHELAENDRGKFFIPAIRAVSSGRGKLILLGVGGKRGSLSEEVRTDETWIKVEWNDQRFLRELEPTSPQAAIIREARTILGHAEYMQFYRLAQGSSGSLPLFDRVPSPPPGLPDSALQDSCKSVLFIGIDVGRVSDSTCLLTLKQNEHGTQIHDVMLLKGESFQRQARGIKGRVRKHLPNVAGATIEMNGLGCGLYDALSAELPSLNLGGQHLSAITRDRLLAGVRLAFNQGTLTCDPALRLPDTGKSVSDHLAALVYVRKGEEYVPEHSDVLSALLMAWISYEGRPAPAVSGTTLWGGLAA
jgi:hypothetical protein